MKLVTTVCAIALSCASAGALAQQKSRISNVTIASGEIRSTPTTIKSARFSGGPIKVTLKDGKTPLDLKSGELIEGLQIQSARVEGGQIGNAEVDWPALVNINVLRGTVVATSLTGSLRVTNLKAVVIAAGPQRIKHEGKDADVAFTSLTVDLTHAEIEQVTIANPELPTAATQQAKPGGKPEEIGLVGDYLKFRVRVMGFAPQGSTTPGTLAAPVNSCFRVSREFDAPDPTDASKTKKYATGTFELVESFSFSKFGKIPGFPPYECETNLGEVAAGVGYDVPLETLNNTDRDRYGWTWGVLVVPFKYYLSTRDFSTGATVGPYVGYRFNDRPGGSIVGGIAVGGASATVKEGDTSTQLNGLSLATTLIFDIKAIFNIGLAVGWDYFSKSDNISLSGKTWLSVSIGRKID